MPAPARPKPCPARRRRWSPSRTTPSRPRARSSRAIPATRSRTRATRPTSTSPLSTRSSPRCDTAPAPARALAAQHLLLACLAAWTSGVGGGDLRREREPERSPRFSAAARPRPAPGAPQLPPPPPAWLDPTSLLFPPFSPRVAGGSPAERHLRHAGHPVAGGPRGRAEPGAAPGCNSKRFLATKPGSWYCRCCFLHCLSSHLPPTWFSGWAATRNVSFLPHGAQTVPQSDSAPLRWHGAGFPRTGHTVLGRPFPHEARPRVLRLGLLHERRPSALRRVSCGSQRRPDSK